MKVVVCMPDNQMYLDVTYDETGRPVYAEGVEELMDFTREYYDSLVIPEEQHKNTDTLYKRIGEKQKNGRQ